MECEVPVTGRASHPLRRFWPSRHPSLLRPEIDREHANVVPGSFPDGDFDQKVRSALGAPGRRENLPKLGVVNDVPDAVGCEYEKGVPASLDVKMLHLWFRGDVPLQHSVPDGPGYSARPACATRR